MINSLISSFAGFEIDVPLESCLDIDSKEHVSEYILPPSLIYCLKASIKLDACLPCFAIQDHFLGKKKAMNLYKDVLDLRDQDKLKPAAMGTIESWKNKHYRGDNIVWLSSFTDSKNSSNSKIGTDASANHAVQNNQSTSSLPGSLNNYMDVMTQLRDELKSRLPHLRISDKMSVQLAHYAGEGCRYTRHLDVNLDAIAKNATEDHRVLTVIYYLNPNWNLEDGGKIRLYDVFGAEKITTEETVNADDAPTSVDLSPLFDRILIFPSDRIEHEVLPTYSDRFALTTWIYGKHRNPSRNTSNTTIVPSLATKSETVYKDERVKSMKDSLSKNRNKAIIRSPSYNAPSITTTTNATGSVNDSSDWISRHNTDTIFVSIISYRDPECQYTINNLFKTAQFPHRVHVGVVYQYNLRGEDMRECFKEPPIYPQNITSLLLPHTAARGPVWARHLAQKHLYNGERFYLQIDSHMRFKCNWDSILIHTLMHKCTNPQKSILTTYPPNYESLGNDNDININNNINNQDPVVLVASHFDKNKMLRVKGKQIKVNGKEETVFKRTEDINDATISGVNIQPSLFYAAGFAFSLSLAMKEVPYDPDLKCLFFGEEISMCVRYFTHGYDFYTPLETLCYHRWSRSYRPSFREIEDDCGTDFRILEAQSMKKVQYLLGIQKLDNNNNNSNSVCSGEDLSYGLGSVRSLGDYEEFAGVEFHTQSLRKRSFLGGCINENVFKNNSSNNNNNQTLIMDLISSMISSETSDK